MMDAWVRPDAADTGEKPENMRILFHSHGVVAFHSACAERATPRQLHDEGETLPVNPAARLLRARELRQGGRLAEAATLLRRATELAPEDAQAWRLLGETLIALGQYRAAVGAARRLVCLEPGEGDAHWLLARAMQKSGRREEALAAYGCAARLSPDDARLHHDHGLALARIGRDEEAEAAFRRSLRLQPEAPAALADLADLAGLLGIQGRDEEVVDLCRRALEVAPGHASARYSLGLALLRRGRFQEGWAAYEARLQASPNSRLPDHPAPFWQGEDLQGKRVLLLPEQELGGQIQCLRYLPLLKARGARVILAAPPSLQRLLGEAGLADELVPVNCLPAADFKLPLMSLPHRFRTDEASVPAPSGYLPLSDPGPAATRNLRAGIVWRGDPGHYDERHRSAPLEYFEGLSMPGVELVSLQMGAATALAQHPFIRSPEPELGDFAGMAAAIAAVDLVICVDTAVAHLAGALGRPVWLLLPEPCDWRWQKEREDSPWYASMSLFRQPRPGDWPAVFATVRRMLAAMADRP